MCITLYITMCTTLCITMCITMYITPCTSPCTTLHPLKDIYAAELRMKRRSAIS